jgi:ribosomal protein L23
MAAVNLKVGFTFFLKIASKYEKKNIHELVEELFHYVKQIKIHTVEP